MILGLLALLTAVLLIVGVAHVWFGNWRTLLFGLTSAVIMAAICSSADIWFPWFDMNRGDGFVLIGLAMVGGIVLGAAFAALMLGILIHTVRAKRLERRVSSQKASS